MSLQRCWGPGKHDLVCQAGEVAKAGEEAGARDRSNEGSLEARTNHSMGEGRDLESAHFHLLVG